MGIVEFCHLVAKVLKKRQIVEEVKRGRKVTDSNLINRLCINLYKNGQPKNRYVGFNVCSSPDLITGLG